MKTEGHWRATWDGHDYVWAGDSGSKECLAIVAKNFLYDSFGLLDGQYEMVWETLDGKPAFDGTYPQDGPKVMGFRSEPWRSGV